MPPEKQMQQQTLIDKKAALLLSLLAIGSVMLWAALAQRGDTRHPISPAIQSRLISGSVATMDSPFFIYSTSDEANSWIIDATGADPSEPADPWGEPSGVITFEYSGDELALQLAVGNYWGYLFVTVDGEPANLLPNIANNHNSLGNPAGYKTFYEPEQTKNGAPIARWVRVHRSPTRSADQLHSARIELWRSWGQVPIRGVAVDALPTDPWPAWPGALLLVLGIGLAWRYYPTLAPSSTRSAWEPLFGALRQVRRGAPSSAIPRRAWNERFNLATLKARVGSKHGPSTNIIYPTALLSILLISAGITTTQSIPALLGLTLLGLVSIMRPSIWLAALLFALPFYFGVTIPILPNRAIGLIDIGILGGVVISLLHYGLDLAQNGRAARGPNTKVGLGAILFLLIGWAFVATVAAEQLDVALREWRIIFLYAGLFAWMLSVPRVVKSDWSVLIGAWLAGGTVVALIALAQWITGSMLIEAEGVFRVRGLYGSPNNLALYLDRTLAVTLALAVYGQLGAVRLWKIEVNVRLAAACCAVVQLLALLLTYSRGSTMLALPVTLLVLMLCGWLTFRHDPVRRRQTWWLAGVALIALLVLAPSLNTERVRGLVDLESGTGFLRRQIWRSGWQMALDHPIFGVGPDNFLYAFRSDYLLPAAWQEPNLNHPHNFALDLLTRLGVPGLLLALAGLLMGLWKIVGNIWRGWLPALNLGLLAAVCAALAHGLIDVGYALPDLMLVWVAIFVFARSSHPNA